MKPIIEVNSISKKYILGERQSYLSLRDVISRGIKNPFKKHVNKKDEFWALKKISFKVKPGEAIGIIGRNGAGKSTLLKILSRITPPTSGEAILRGRVGSLLEVGTGFHQELTGRENIYLNGSILGMKRREIEKKFDEIVEFSGVEKFLDTPVKHYSSGMYMRLAFSVAAHLESEILIVDEVLAVGDTEFQKKCLGKMGEISKTEGRTLIFVSHNLAAIKNLCSRVILVDKGKIVSDGPPDKVVAKYINESIVISNKHKKFVKNRKLDIQFVKSSLEDEEGNPKNIFECDEAFTINFSVFVNKKASGLYGYLNINKEDGSVALESDSLDLNKNQMENLDEGLHHIKLKIPKRTLSPGKYYIYLNFSLLYGQETRIEKPGIIGRFTLIDNNSGRGNGRKGYLSTLLEWKQSKK